MAYRLQNKLSNIVSNTTYLLKGNILFIAQVYILEQTEERNAPDLKAIDLRGRGVEYPKHIVELAELIPDSQAKKEITLIQDQLNQMVFDNLDDAEFSNHKNCSLCLK